MSVQLSDDGVRAALAARRSAPRPETVAGLRYALPVVLAPLGGGLLPAPRPGRFGLVCAWDDEPSCAAWLDRPGGRLAGGYEVRLRPTRIVGAWPELGAVDVAPPPGGDGPVAVLTLGRLRPRRALSFLRASAAAERDALASPGLVLATGMARPPGLVATFSLWRDAAAMRAYVDRAGGGHRAATAARGAKPFHAADAFVRFTPYAEHGAWRPGIR